MSASGLIQAECLRFAAALKRLLRDDYPLGDRRFGLIVELDGRVRMELSGLDDRDPAPGAVTKFILIPDWAGRERMG